MISSPTANALQMDARNAEQFNPLQRFGYCLLLIFLFLAYSRVLEFGLTFLHIPLAISVLTLLTTIATGGVQRALFSRAGLFLSAFTLWLIAGLPFSDWKFNSLQMVKNEWLKSFLVFVFVAGLLRSVDQCRKAMYAISYAVLTIALICVVLRTEDVEGRLAVGQGTLANANDLAQMLLIGVPFWLLMAMDRTGAPFRRLIAGLCIIPLLAVILATGSRSSVMGILAMLLVAFLTVSLANKMKLLLATAALALLILPMLPSEMRQRYGTLLDTKSKVRVGSVEVSAVASADLRLRLLRQSIQMTIRRPFFGVGVGNFASSSASPDEDRSSIAWRQTHNAYTQISSEAGLPALFFYIGALVCCWRGVKSIYKTSRKLGEVTENKMSYCLLLSLVSAASTAFFSSMAYNIYVPTLAGLSVAFARCARAEMSTPKSLSPMVALQNHFPQPTASGSQNSASSLPSRVRTRVAPV